MNDMTRSASSEASALIEDFLAANPLPSSEQWKAFTLAHPAHASQIADTALMLTLDDADFDAEELDVELFNATRSAMLNEVHLNSVPIVRPCDYGLILAIDGLETQLGSIEAYNRLATAAEALKTKIDAGKAVPQNPLFAVSVRG